MRELACLEKPKGIDPDEMESEELSRSRRCSGEGASGHRLYWGFTLYGIIRGSLMELGGRSLRGVKYCMYKRFAAGRTP